MPGFVRRYGYFPGVDVLQQVEGVIIVDLAPPGSIQGVGTGVACLVGEFADVTYGVAVASDGSVTTLPVPTEVFSAQDFANKFGGWDETIGEFGGDMGNGFVELRNKKFFRLVLVPINLASPKGIRLWRKLPTNKSAADATPVVPLQTGVVNAGREFKSGANRVRVLKRIVFTASDPTQTGTDANTATTGSAATQTITMASGLFVTKGVKEGDLLVLGVISGAGYLGANADTYRIVSVDSETQLTLQKLDGTSFTFTDEASASQPWRVHPSTDADTGLDHQLSEEQGYLIPARPLDATVVTATLLTPTVVPTALSSSSADPLSGLMARTTTNAAGLVYDANVQAPNAPNHASLDALYATAVDTLLTEDMPGREVNLLWAARKSANNRTKLKNHVLEASQRGLTRTAAISPPLDTLTQSSALGDSDPGVGANRDERVAYAWPGVRTFVPEAVNFSIKGADQVAYTDGILDTTTDGWLTAVESNLAPERNPGQGSPPVPAVLAPVVGLQRGAPSLTMPDYIQFRAKGIVSPRMDRTAGPVFQSGVTTSLTAGQKNIARRRMADFIQDSCASRLVEFSKQPLTDQLKDAAVGEVDAFMKELLSPNNPPARRIAGYEIDDKSGNTPELDAKGIFVIIVRVRTLSTADFIVLQTEIGEGVVLASAA